jgi:hypothetical protein
MGTRLDKMIIGHCRKTLPVQRRTSPVSWRCVLPVVPGICNLINGLFDPIAVGCQIHSHSIIYWPCNALSSLMFAQISTRVSVSRYGKKRRLAAIDPDVYRAIFAAIGTKPLADASIAPSIR